MKSDTTPATGGSPAPRYGVALRVTVAVLAVAVAVASVLAWQLVSERPAPARATLPTTTVPPRGVRSTQPPPRTARTVPPTTTTTAGPLRVLEIGDSLGVDLGVAMERDWPSTAVQLTMAARTDTGLTNSAFFDWPAALSGLLASADPQVVVVFLGANDLQSMVTGSTILADGTPAWNAAYEARVTSIVSESIQAGAKVLWVGEPAMQDPFLNAGMARLDAIAQGVIVRHPGDAAYLSSDATLAPGGTFTVDAAGPTGQQQAVRTPDGVHLMPAGADLLAAAVSDALANAWGMVTVHG